MSEIPSWAVCLSNYYVSVRVNRRNATLRRRYYRLIEVEKLRLAELGINQKKILAICRLLSNEKCVRGYHLKSCFDLAMVVSAADVQLVLNLSYYG